MVPESHRAKSNKTLQDIAKPASRLVGNNSIGAKSTQWDSVDQNKKRYHCTVYSRNMTIAVPLHCPQGHSDVMGSDGSYTQSGLHCS